MTLLAATLMCCIPVSFVAGAWYQASMKRKERAALRNLAVPTSAPYLIPCPPSHGVHCTCTWR